MDTHPFHTPPPLRDLRSWYEVHGEEYGRLFVGYRCAGMRSVGMSTGDYPIASVVGGMASVTRYYYVTCGNE